MPYLTWISDENLKKAVISVLEKGMAAKNDAPANFNKNVVDPFSAVFEVAAFKINNFNDWKHQELNRQAQKTLQNHIGNFHQEILGYVEGWENLKVGSNTGSDLFCTSRKIIAEVKNKHNTLTGGKLITQYDDFDSLISLKSSRYYGYTAYYVTIIPKTTKPFDQEFTPSDKKKGKKCSSNPKIRMIDGASFYALVTGQPSALTDLYQILPNIIENIFQKEFDQKDFKINDKQEFISLFESAYGKK